MITLIISYYKNIPALTLIFEALKRQTFREFEVIVAEDANDDTTVLFLKQCQEQYFFPIRHIGHEDCGFRKTKILNDAIRIAQGEKLVFLDGDCVPHRHFLKTYNRYIKDGCYCYGRRVGLGKNISEKALTTQNPELFSILNIHYFSSSKCIAEGIYLPFRPTIRKQDREISGSNWGILKKYVLQVNGFDEDYTLPCFGEDLDIGWRLKKIGIQLLSVKNKAIQYHLFHEVRYNATIMAEGRKKFETKKSEGKTFCKNGINK